MYLMCMFNNYWSKRIPPESSFTGRDVVDRLVRPATDGVADFDLEKEGVEAGTAIAAFVADPIDNGLSNLVMAERPVRLLL